MEQAPTIGELLRAAASRLAPHSQTPRLDAELLLAHVLGWQRAQLVAESRATIEQAQRAEFARLLARREALEPVAYLVGRKEFWGLELYVDRRALVPRPETELLVERALVWARGRARALRVADLGTGSGCIAIALAHSLPQALVYALDSSPEALEVARINIERHGLQGRIQLLESAGLSGLPSPVELIVSNPPYTILAEIDEGVRRHEPHEALDGGPDGLSAYRWLLPAARSALLPGGALLLEIGAGQGQAVVELAREAFAGAAIQVLHDLAGHERVVEIIT